MSNSNATKATQTPDQQIADRILTALSDKDFTQAELAQEIGISYSKLRRGLEQHRGDRRSFTILELINIAGALNIPASALIPEMLVAA